MEYTGNDWAVTLQSDVNRFTSSMSKTEAAMKDLVAKMRMIQMEFGDTFNTSTYVICEEPEFTD